MTREPESKLFNLFPTPLQRVRNTLNQPLLEALVARFSQLAQQPNARSEQLLHSPPTSPEADELLSQAGALLLPHVVSFGALLLGEQLPWAIKETWVNVLATGGQQALHNHANSFVSGIVYLTPSHSSANTVFHKAPGGSDFVFNNANARAQLGPYNAERWLAPDPQPGDLLLFPSYVLHEVPVNRGEQRVSLAFNAIPLRLDSWGYTLTLSG